MDISTIPLRRGRLEAIAKLYGETIDDLVPRIVQEEGTINKAAARLHVTPATVRKVMVRLGYVAKAQAPIVWEREPEPVP